MNYSRNRNANTAKAIFVPGGFGVAALLEGYYLAPLGFSWVALALVITVVLAIGWMRTW